VEKLIWLMPMIERAGYGGWQTLSPTVAPRISASRFFLVAARKSMW
jgi:hypothetical protein